MGATGYVVEVPRWGIDAWYLVLCGAVGLAFL